MNPHSRNLLISAALIGPPLLGILSTELSYFFNRPQQSWPFVAFYAVPQVLAVLVLFKILSWRWWIKCLAAVPFTALSFLVTVVGSLGVAAANGNGL